MMNAGPADQNASVSRRAWARSETGAARSVPRRVLAIGTSISASASSRMRGFIQAIDQVGEKRRDHVDDADDDHAAFSTGMSLRCAANSIG